MSYPGASTADPIQKTPGTASSGNLLPSDPAQESKAFFRRVDWLALLIVFLCVWTGYYLTLAPEVTLEDSGELATGSFYAGIPHPPGYPVWTIYTWLWTVLLPFKNVAWRVALGEATSGALAAGLLAMLVSRGSSLLLQSIEELRSSVGSAQNSICLTAGFVSGMLLGFNGFMWSQSVIVEVYSFSVASFMVVLLCLLRWSHAPRRHRYLYLALFFHGICFTNHQTLVVAAMGIEVIIAAANFRLGRYLFLGNSVLFLGGLFLKQQHILTAWDQNQAIFIIFNVVGVSSIACYIWFSFLSNETATEFCLDASLAAFFVSLTWIPTRGGPIILIALAALAALIYLTLKTRSLGLEWLVVIACGCCWILGASFYFYMPLAGMTNPPMQWGYPRTVEGFIHAFTRGQYEKTNPTDILHDPLRFITQLSMLGDGIIEEFNWVYALMALVPFLFFFKLQKRERAWLLGITAVYLCLGVLLLILLNPPPDRAAQQLVRVFFTASHTIIALLVGYALALIGGYLASHYQVFRFWGLAGGAVAIAFALFSFTDLTSRTFFGETAKVGPGQLLAFVGRAFTHRYQYAMPIYAGLLLTAITLLFVLAIWFKTERPPVQLVLLLFALMPVHSILTHWADNEQRNHWFGYYFGHDMFSPPFERKEHQALYPAMTKDSILFGGTDPGRFCPTYMIFCDSFIPHWCQPAADRNFDRRDVYIITQNALADGTYLEYIRAQYNRSAQIDPPFFQELLRSDQERTENIKTNALARTVEPLDHFFEKLGDQVEKKRRTFTSWFKPDDFLAVKALAAKLRPTADQDPVSKFLYQRLSPETQRLLQGANEQGLQEHLAKDFNNILETDVSDKTAAPSGQSLFESTRFQSVTLSDYLRDFIGQNPQGSTRIRLNRLLLEAAYPRELAKSPGGIYPDLEIYIPTGADFARSYNDYAIDAQRRLQLNQLKPGEDVRRMGNRVQVSGPGAVMGINGLLTKVIFDHNPKNDFFIEESMPMDWMYPFLSPYGIIMKINRQPLQELTEDAVNTDHEFWSLYLNRFIGNWINYDTPVQQIASWAERLYLRRDFDGFMGDPRFIRDDQAQKSFSKLRSAIGGLYLWRINSAKPGSPERARMIKEADFAFRQAFALCPYNPEVLFHYVNLLVGPEVQRLDDALLLVKTSQKLDPFNASIADLLHRLEEWKGQRSNLDPNRIERQLKQNPGDLQAVLNLASEYFQLGQTNQALLALDRVLKGRNVPAPLLRSLLPVYTTLSNREKLQQTTELLASEYQNEPTNLDAAIGAAEGYRALQQPQLAVQFLDQVLNSPSTDPNIILQAAQQLIGLADYNRVEKALEKLTRAAPTSPEAWYDLAALESIIGKPAESLASLSKALALNNARRLRDPKGRDLADDVKRDPRFNAVRSLPEFKKLTGEN